MKMIRSMMTLLLVLLSAMAVAQSAVSGVVRDPAGEPIIGANVVVQGTTNGTITDLDGNFTLQCDKNATLEVSYIGYTSQQVALKGQTSVVVVLKEDNEELDEVVVIGYGTMDKKELTSAVAHVSAKDFLSVSATDPSMMIQGKVAGVSITNTGAGDPNNQASIQIRGVASRAAGNGPLIVIDGVPGGSLTNLNPNDIESFDILKDGAASAIYGTRGSNGVVLVTTKKGSKNGTFHASYAANLAINTIVPELKMMNAQEFRDVRLGWGDNGVDLGGNDNWLDAVTRTGITHQHTITLSGGTQQSSYRASVDFKDAQGVDLRSARREYGGRGSFSHTTKGGLFTFNVNLAPRYVEMKKADWGVFKDALEANPTTPIMDPSNPAQYYNFQGQVVGSNPVERLKLEKDDGVAKMLDWDASVKLNLLPLFAKPDMAPMTLNTQVTFAEHIYDNDDAWFRPSTSTICQNGGVEGEASRSYSKERQYMLEWLGNYGVTLGEHNLKAMIGYSYQYSKYSGFNAQNKDFPNDGLTYNNLGTGEYMQDEEGRLGMGSYANDAKLIAFFGRISYDYHNRYYLTASLRYEGSSKFGANHKWGYFPAVSAGWRISQEEFMKDVKWVNELKLRADFGVTGNQNFDSYKSLNTMSGFGYYYYNGKYFQVWGPSKNVNPDLHWEKGINWNIGVDFAVLDSRLSGTVNYFNRTQKDLLGDYKVSVPPYLHDQTFVNVGTMKNQGVEIELTGQAVKTKLFDYTINFIGTWQSNKFVDFSNSEYVGQDYYNTMYCEDPYPFYYLQRIEKGQSLGNFYMWKYAGFTEDGEWVVYDKNGDMILAAQATEEDKQIVGNGMPKFTMSMTHTFRIQNFDLSLFFRGAFGYDIFNIHDFYYGTRSFTGNVLCKAYGKNFGISPSTTPIACDYFIERGDYLKLDMINAGYTWKFPNAKFIDGLRIYGTAKNLFTLTKFSGIDPSNYQVNGLNPGCQSSRSYYPSTRQFIMGIQVDF